MRPVGSVLAALVGLWLGSMPLTAEAVHLRGTVRQVGFPGVRTEGFAGTAHYCRPGEWVPIRVELTNDDGDRFLGWIEVRQRDRNGDAVVSRRQVSVEGTRAFWLCVPAGVHPGPEAFQVRVQSQDGRLAALFDDGGEWLDRLRSTLMVEPAPREAWMLLDISARPLAQLGVVDGDVEFAQEWIVLRSAPEAIPDQAAGLVMADTIVWDKADPSVMDLAQLDALIEWTRLGGRLVLGVERTWELVGRSRLAPLLPARLKGTAALSAPPAWLTRFLGIGTFDVNSEELDPPLTYCPVTEADLADNTEVAVPAADTGDSPAPDGPLLVVRRPFGRGEVVLVTASLADLLHHGRRNGPMLHQLFETRYASSPEDQQGYMWQRETDLFSAIQARTGFGVTASLYLLVAFAFVVIYTALNVGGGWAWLKRRMATRYAWVAFAALGLVGSGVSLVAVKWIRGWTYRVEEVTIVDGSADSSEAVATCFFGLKAPTHTKIDLRVPADWRHPDDLDADSPLLTALPADPSRIVSHFAASEQYEALAPIGELRSVPTRATVRQFEARWAGPIGGQVAAGLHRLHEGTVELAASSWIENKLGVDLRNCYLLVASRDLEPDRPHRDLLIFVYALGDLLNGQRVTWTDLAALQAESGAKPAQATGTAPASLVRPTQLRRVLQREWLRDLVALSEPDDTWPEEPPLPVQEAFFTRALLALTVFEEIDTQSLLSDFQALVRSYGQRLDRSDALTRTRALLVGFSDRPGPARLCLRPTDRPTAAWRPLTPNQATTMYRIALPIAEMP